MAVLEIAGFDKFATPAGRSTLQSRGSGHDLLAGFDLYSLRTDFDPILVREPIDWAGSADGLPIGDRTSLGLTYSLIQDDTQIANVLVDHDNDSSIPPTINATPRTRRARLSATKKGRS